MDRYLSIPSLAEYLDCSVRTVERIIATMKSEKRFKKRTFLTHPRRVYLADIVEYCSEMNACRR